MSLDNIKEGDYGQVIQLTIIDVDTGSAADVSAYTTSQKMYFYDPSGNAAVVKTAAFDSDGSDGLINYTIESGLFDEGGNWFVEAEVTSGSAVLTSIRYQFYVEPQ